MTQAYNTIAAGGFRNNLTTIREVVTKEGKAVNRFPMKTELAMPEGAAYLTTWALRKVMREGTAMNAYLTLPKVLELAGKTGTTDDERDSWFAGFGGNRVAVIWVGRDDNKPIGMTGADGALPVWTALMKTLRPRGPRPDAAFGHRGSPGQSQRRKARGRGLRVGGNSLRDQLRAEGVFRLRGRPVPPPTPGDSGADDAETGDEEAPAAPPGAATPAPAAPAPDRPVRAARPPSGVAQ